MRHCLEIFSGKTEKISIHAPTWGATLIYLICTEFVSISIHAPTWGATILRKLGKSMQRISIHAPTWGATYKDFIFSNLSKFQSTHPRGVRLGPVKGVAGEPDISIHAPTWGATHCQLRWRRDHSHFNPRTHVGCDLGFNPGRTRDMNFNPRTHVGCDGTL